MLRLLPLDDELWSTLEPSHWRRGDLVSSVREWLRSVGRPDEMERFGDFGDAVMRDGETSIGAYALAPYMVDVCRQGRTPFIVDYLTIVGMIELNRLARKPGTPGVPETLLEDYSQAVQDASNLVTPAIRGMDQPLRTWALRSVRPVFRGDWELAMRYWNLEIPPPEE
jgi:hypothetical protein